MTIKYPNWSKWRDPLICTACLIYIIGQVMYAGIIAGCGVAILLTHDGPIIGFGDDMPEPFQCYTIVYEGEVIGGGRFYNNTENPPTSPENTTHYKIVFSLDNPMGNLNHINTPPPSPPLIELLPIHDPNHRKTDFPAKHIFYDDFNIRPEGAPSPIFLYGADMDYENDNSTIELFYYDIKYPSGVHATWKNLAQTLVSDSDGGKGGPAPSEMDIFSGVWILQIHHPTTNEHLGHVTYGLSGW